MSSIGHTVCGQAACFVSFARLSVSLQAHLQNLENSSTCLAREGPTRSWRPCNAEADQVPAKLEMFCSAPKAQASKPVQHVRKDAAVPEVASLPGHHSGEQLCFSVQYFCCSACSWASYNSMEDACYHSVHSMSFPLSDYANHSILKRLLAARSKFSKLCQSGRKIR